MVPKGRGARPRRRAVSNTAITDFGIVALGRVHTLDISETGVTDVGGTALIDIGKFHALTLDSSTQRAKRVWLLSVCTWHGHRSRAIQMARCTLMCTLKLAGASPCCLCCGFFFSRAPFSFFSLSGRLFTRKKLLKRKKEKEKKRKKRDSLQTRDPSLTQRRFFL